jgi:aspartate aminotransferase
MTATQGPLQRPLHLGISVDTELVNSEEVVSRAIERLLKATHPHDRIPLGGAPVVDLPPHIIEAAQSKVACRGSSPSVGEPMLRRAIAKRLKSEGVVYSEDQIVITNGAMQALDVCFRTLLNRGDEVLVPEPRFFIHGLVSRAAGNLIGFPSPERHSFRPDWAAARRRITSRTRLLFLNSPVNPTGYVFDEDDIAEAARLAVDNDLWIVSDESYSHFVYDGLRHLLIASDPAVEGRTITVRSFSKDYAMHGWRIGFLAAPKRLVRSLAITLEWSCLSVGQVAQFAALAALDGPQDWVTTLVAQAERQGSMLARGLNAIHGVRCHHPRGGLNILVGVSGDANKFARSLVTDMGVPAHPGEAFGAPGFFRLQFGATDAALQAVVDRTRKIADRLCSDSDAALLATSDT